MAPMGDRYLPIVSSYITLDGLGQFGVYGREHAMLWVETGSISLVDFAIGRSGLLKTSFWLTGSSTFGLVLFLCRQVCGHATGT